MREDQLHRLRVGRDRRRRNRTLGTVAVALILAGGAIAGTEYAVGGLARGRPASSPTGNMTPNRSAGATGSSGRAEPPTGSGLPAISGPIQFIDAEHGWMVDVNGQILATGDGGASWNIQLSGPSNVKAVYLLTHDRGGGW